MRSNSVAKRLLSVFLVLCMVCAWVLPANAANDSISVTQVSNDRVSAGLVGKDAVELEEEVPQYEPTEIVRVSIFLNQESVIEAGYAMTDLMANDAALAYRAEVKKQQDSVTAQIESVIQTELDVVWNLTLVTNLISAYVEYGQIAAIEKVAGVRLVVIETPAEPDVVSISEADPNMATSGVQTGTMASYVAGYTGAGSRIAIIDTGLDTEHLSFDAAAYEYSLSLLAEKAGKSVEEYVAGLNLLDAEEIAGVLSQLNASKKMSSVTAEDLYLNSKIGFGFNYVDSNLNIGHMSDTQGEHGSHVSGIATANAYVPNGDGTFSNALEKVYVQGVAPDAQIVVMKVFGAKGGAYPADYMAAIEDAIVLDVDSINMSLGSGNPGMSSAGEYEAIYKRLENSGVVLSNSAGNAYAWMDFAENGVPYMYLDDVSMQTGGSPGSYTNSLSVASINNAGFISTYAPVVFVNGKTVSYYDSNDYGTSYGNTPFSNLGGEYEFVFLNGIGTPEQFAALGEGALEGKIAMCYRGETSFFEKCNAAVAAGAIAVIVVNNVDETFGMNLTGYEFTAPAVSISLSAGEKFKMNPITNEAGTVMGWTGTLEVPVDSYPALYGDEYYTMSEFSSWGVPGSLELKPEVTAPGGDILSVNGANKYYGNNAHDQYEVMSGTSMAAPQVAGMAAVLAQYIRENNLEEATGLDARTLAQSLLMSTAVPVLEGANGGYYYSVMKQGAGLANVGNAVMADSYIIMGADATKSWADGKVKVELGDDPARTGVYTFTFSINNLTDEDEMFALYADFFTQGAFASGNALYMDTMTTPLQPMVTYTVDGEPLAAKNLPASYDFNGDGTVNAFDGQMILEYATGAIAEIADNADLNADGVVTTDDAYLFFVELGKNGTTVAANGSVTVEVTVTLSASDRAWLAYYENGAYLEGFVYAESIGSVEGVMGTTHSIPVLGFYGNWSDASMFEKGSYNEYMSGEEYRAPYLYTTVFSQGIYNGLQIKYEGDSNVYWFGGNPVVADAVYMPERDAINNSTVISKMYFTAIRNAADSYFVVMDEEGFLVAEQTGEVSSAYYYVNGQAWKNTYYTLGANLTTTGLEENSRIEVGMMLVPEYYVDSQGYFDISALGAGAYKTFGMTVDNTAPVLEDISLSLLKNTLTITASDNQYIAGIALYNKTGKEILAYTGAKADIQPGESAEYVLDLSAASGSKFLLQVVDYAMNITTYEIKMNSGDDSGDAIADRIAFYPGIGAWVDFDRNTQSSADLAENTAADYIYYAGTVVDDYAMATTGDGTLHIMPLKDLGEVNVVANLGLVFTDLAYNAADGLIYGVADNNLYTIDKLNGAVAEIGTIGVSTNTLACDANGTFYCNMLGSGEIYSFTLETMDAPVMLVNVNSYKSQAVQAMEIDPNTGLLCWTSYAKSTGLVARTYCYYYEINTTEATYTQYKNLGVELTALLIPDKTSGDNWTTPTNTVTGIQISTEKLDLLAGATATLTALVQPWTATDRTVSWQSADPAVATVDENGVVTALTSGTTTITAISNLDPSISATCTVTVSTMPITINGVLQDAEGVSQFFTWNMENDPSWTGGAKIEGSMTSATMDTLNNKLYMMSAGGSTMYLVNPETGAIEASGANSVGVPLWDMEYSTFFSTEEAAKVNAVYGYYFFPAKDPMNLDASVFGLQSYLNKYTGASYFVACASMGADTYSASGVTHDVETLVLLDDMGCIWWIYLYDNGDGTYGAGLSYEATGLTDLGLDFSFTGDDMYCSMVATDYDNLYVSVFTGDTNEIYHLYFDYDAFAYEAEYVGDFGDSVWPAILTSVTNNHPVEAESVRRPEAILELTSTKVTAAELAAVAQTAETTETEEKTYVSFDVTSEYDSTNGVVTASWNTDELTLVNVLVNADYYSVEQSEGSVTVAYVALEAIEVGDAIVTLVFEAVDPENVNVSVEFVESGLGYCLHKKQVLVGDVKATCTEPGYTGDVYCAGCGKLLTVGEAIPAGHQYTGSVTVAPTVEVAGSIVLTCQACDEAYTLTLPALNENDYSCEVVLAPTATADGLNCYTWNETAYGTFSFYATVAHEVNTDAAQMVINSVEAKAGNVVVVEVLLKNNPGIQGIIGRLVYDESVMTLLSIENGTVLADMDQGLNLLWTADAESTEDGVLCTITFQMAENAPAGAYPVAFILEDAVNEAEEDVQLHVVFGSVTVSDICYGDVNGDGKVTLADALRLRKYLANRDPETGACDVTIEAGADANGDGKVNLNDVLRLRKYLASRDPITGESSVVLGPQ